MARRRNISVFGIFSSRIAAENAIELLRQNSFSASDISALVPSNDSPREFALSVESKAPEGAVIGGGSGALLGGALGWLAGIGAITIPGVGPLLAAGPVMGLLAGIGAGSMVGGLTGALIGAGIPEYEARRYEGRIRDGGILLSVHVNGRGDRERAQLILERAGGEDVSSTSESRADYGASYV